MHKSKSVSKKVDVICIFFITAVTASWSLIQGCNKQEPAQTTAAEADVSQYEEQHITRLQSVYMNESVYLDETVEIILEHMNRRLSYQLGDNAPEIRLEPEDKSTKLPFISMTIEGASVYDVLSDIAERAGLSIIVEKDSIILRWKNTEG